jgi:hypothetical protein
MDQMKISILNLKLLVSLLIYLGGNTIVGQDKSGLKIKFIDYFFENGSPLLWQIENDTLLKISLLPDYQRQTLNRQTDHWYFRIIAEKGTRVRMKIEKMLPDVYNGKPATDWWNYKTGIPCYFSYDNSTWTALQTTTLPDKGLFIDFVMSGESVYVARLPVYTTTHLGNLLERLSNQSDIKVIPVGRTVENRPLEIIQLGNPNAEFQVILRARAHPWEPGGNWVLEGFIDEFMHQTSKAFRENFCFYIMPMANKDGVVRGLTRFNTAGMDINRNWDSESDSLLCPEKYYLEKFIEGLINKGKMPSLVIDLHNDDKGDIHLAKRNREDTVFQANMQEFEKLMHKYTSFSESMRYEWNEKEQTTVMTIENGLYARYGIEAFVYELNANWISGLNKIPSADDWKETGKGLIRVLFRYLEKD